MTRVINCLVIEWSYAISTNLIQDMESRERQYGMADGVWPGK